MDLCILGSEFFLYHENLLYRKNTFLQHGLQNFCDYKRNEWKAMSLSMKNFLLTGQFNSLTRVSTPVHKRKTKMYSLWITGLKGM